MFFLIRVVGYFGEANHNKTDAPRAETQLQFCDPAPLIGGTGGRKTLSPKRVVCGWSRGGNFVTTRTRGLGCKGAHATSWWAPNTQRVPSRRPHPLFFCGSPGFRGFSTSQISTPTQITSLWTGGGDSNPTLRKKGLRFRNSPTCTLSQNGYSAMYMRRFCSQLLL